MNKVVESHDTPNDNDATLMKYKKKQRDADEVLAKDEAERKKRVLKEQRRLMGRTLPFKAEEEHERSL